MKINKKCHPPHKRLSIWVYECCSKCNSLWQLVISVCCGFDGVTFHLCWIYSVNAIRVIFV